MQGRALQRLHRLGCVNAILTRRLGSRLTLITLADSFNVFERNYPTLIAIDSHGFMRNKLNFFDREREEMRVLTQASEVAENVWVSLRVALGAHVTAR